LDDDPTKKGRILAETVVRGPLAELSEEDLRRYAILVSVARNDVRQRIVLELTQRAATLSGVQHPSAILSRHATIHPTAQIMAGVVVNAGAVVSAHAVLNTSCIVEHDAEVAEFTHIGPGAVIAGAAVIEQAAFVASAATVCPFVRVGTGSTLGAGAVALRDVPSFSVAVGVPAKTIRTVV
jgi:acetyltransferase EpsM